MKIARDWNEDEVTTDLMNEVFVALDRAAISGDMVAEVYNGESGEILTIIVNDRKFELRLWEVL